MGQDSFIPVATNARSRSDLVERGFSRQPLRVDVDIARSLEALSHAAWSVPKDKYYDGIQLSVCPTDEQEGRFATSLSVSQYRRLGFPCH